MKSANAMDIEDLHRIAKRRTPKVTFDYFEGGAEDEPGLARNEAEFWRHRLVPRYLVDVSEVRIGPFQRTRFGALPMPACMP